MKIDRLALLFAYLFIGFIVGFDIAWILMKIPTVDMSMNTGIFIPIGLVLALIGGIVRIYVSTLKLPRLAISLFMIVFASLTLYTLASLISNLKAASVVAPILIREGLNLRSLSILTVSWGTFIFLGLGLLSLIISILRSVRRE